MSFIWDAFDAARSSGLLQIVDDSIDFKTRIDNVLTETGFTEARPAKMTIDDLLKYVCWPTLYVLKS